MTEHSLKIALVGNPNAGKTTLFNQLTGARQHVGNYPGITVDHKEGFFQHHNQLISITDLPGTYSLTAYSVEELVARDYLVNNKPDVVLNIVDASNLERNLYLTCQLLELGAPLVIALNMMDVARDRGIEINAEKLEQLLKIPIVPIVARSGKGTPALLDMILEAAVTKHAWISRDITYGADIDGTLNQLTEIIEQHNYLTDIYPSRYTAIKILENDEQILEIGKDSQPEVFQQVAEIADEVSVHTKKTLDVYPEAIIADHRYGYIRSIVRQGVIKRIFDADRLYASDKIDKVLTNRIAGPIIMLSILYGLYTFTFAGSEFPVSWTKSGIAQIGLWVESIMPDGPLKSLIVSGVIDGVGGVLGFVPLIMFMFLGIAILEDSGYLARVAFMMDRVFRIFGLHGSSVMPFIVSGGIAGGCAVPGVMATRTLRSPKERMATLLTVPFMNCGAKVPVLALLIGTFFAEHKALFMFLFSMLAWLVAMLAAKFLRSTVLRGEPTPFVMELPPYRFPTVQGLLIHTWERTWQYMKKAGTVILGISILIWAMMTYPGLDSTGKAEFGQQQQAAAAAYSEEIREEASSTNKIVSEKATALREQLATIKAQESEANLTHSIAGKIGIAIEPVSRLAGFDWRTNIALLGGIAAKEVIISTLGTAYSIGSVSAENRDQLADRLQKDPRWTSTSVIAALIFIMFYAPCFVTVVCIAKEASWKWAVFSICFNTFFAFLLAAAVFQAGLHFGVH